VPRPGVACGRTVGAAPVRAPSGTAGRGADGRAGAGVVLAVIVAARGGFVQVEPWRWALVPACVAAIVLTERYPVKIAPEQKVNLGALPALIAVLLLPPGVGPATAAVGVLAGNVVVRRTWWETLFSAGDVLVGSG